MALQLADRNIEAGVATEEDYLLKGMVLRALYDTPEHNQKALDNIIKAKTININAELFPQIDREEGITLLRLGRKADAAAALQAYIQKMEVIQQRLETLNKDTQDVVDEIVWAKKMIYKTKVT